MSSDRRGSESISAKTFELATRAARETLMRTGGSSEVLRVVISAVEDMLMRFESVRARRRRERGTEKRDGPRLSKARDLITVRVVSQYSPASIQVDVV